jgi:hypothetical protein
MAVETVPEMLNGLADIYKQRNELYGDNYKEFGNWASKLFPLGLTIETAEDWNRFGVLIQIMSKLSRYAQKFPDDNHEDSLDDMAVYAMMLQELDKEMNNG